MTKITADITVAAAATAALATGRTADPATSRRTLQLRNRPTRCLSLLAATGTVETATASLGLASGLVAALATALTASQALASGLAAATFKRERLGAEYAAVKPVAHERGV